MNKEEEDDLIGLSPTAKLACAANMDPDDFISDCLQAVALAGKEILELEPKARGLSYFVEGMLVTISVEQSSTGMEIH